MQTVVRYVDVTEQLQRAEQPIVVLERKRTGYSGSEFVLSDKPGGGKVWVENKSSELLRIPMHAYQVHKDPAILFVSAADHTLAHFATLTELIQNRRIYSANFMVATQREDLGDMYRIYFGLFVGVVK